MKGTDEVIKEFNEIVNMTADELEKWLKSDDSNSAGWSKDDGDGESVGHDSGRQITEILKNNPKKDPEKYTDDQIDHMRKVVSYCKRHLAQEEKANEKKPAEEVKKTKSYASLKNWGHDPLKKRGEQHGSGNEPNGEKEEEQEKEEEDDKQAGDKRKKTDSQSGTNKSQKTSQRGEEADGNEDGGNDEEDEEEDDDEEGEKKSRKQTKSNGSNGSSKKDTNNENGDGSNTNGQPKKGPKPGDTVSWNWGNGQPEGKVLDVKGEKTSIQTKRGNEVSRDGEPEDPAVVLDTGKSKAIKLDHELN